jgi:hypothetical protein
VDSQRHPAALAGAITKTWQPYRWRAYAVGIASGLLIGGVAGPILTTSLLFASAMAGVALPTTARWADVVWTVLFAVTAPVAGAAAYVRWQPARLRMAAQTYLWLAAQAEAHWHDLFGAQPVPRDEAGIRAALASMAETAETAGERFGLWMAMLDLDRARAALRDMPETSADDRFSRASAAWLVAFTEGSTPALDSLEQLADEIAEPDSRLEAGVSLAVLRARIALAEGGDWQAPLTAVRAAIGDSANVLFDRFLRQAMFRSLLMATTIGVVVFWIVVLGLGPHVAG